MIKTIHHWKNIALVEETIIYPNGQTLVHTTIKHPGAAVILPITADKRIIVIRQFRPSLKKWLLELPAGTIENNETALECAQRELEEETGYSGEQFFELGQVTPMAGFCDEIQYLFVAKQLTKTQRFQCDDDELIEVLSLTMEELEQYIIDGDISDAKTIACLSKAKLCGYV
ncbi:NUDIX hydrolase [Vibrio metschnikovii]|jgi:ADP-ribose pyrophosphatase|uniref:NUDIX hydrolase n=6 Tax=Unclassified Bacteria TaxID=49928 RepID=A0AAU6T301_UNCXX|nr:MULTISPECIES: NUDIX hydrolase [Vibrio]EKO3557687.1 NUDIX hydrolase [Vibrio metschnikovii]EKO3565314.1 NUDIX hydrolase [Vibrio metschnikovii]EKO3567211.1 NUDIX hydrolase [Vibrio metschnikovii]EKO3570509.1 NUDIX hydrolase [Vibrio metschnikovii]EKO3574988.1 NUDIX hydrolase [Vibrio metschnikovii]